MSTKPIIDAPGLYLTRDGRTLEVVPNVGAFRRTHPWVPKGGGILSSVTSHGRACLKSEREFGIDIVAKAPAPSATKPRPAKGKKAKRRYVAHHNGHPNEWDVRSLQGKALLDIHAHGMTRSLARRVAAMLNTQN